MVQVWYSGESSIGFFERLLQSRSVVSIYHLRLPSLSSSEFYASMICPVVTRQQFQIIKILPDLLTVNELTSYR